MWIRRTLALLLVQGVICSALSTNAAPIEVTEQNLEEFMRKTLEAVRPYLTKGSKELGIRVLDPMDLPDYHFENPGELVSIMAHFSHLKLPGLSAFKVDSITANPKTLSIELKYSFPSLAGLGDYTFETRAFTMPVVATTGRCSMTAKTIKATGLVQLAKDSSGKLRCESVRLQSTEENVELNMENLANDSILRNVLDPRSIYNEYKPRIYSKISDAFKKMMNFTLKDSNLRAISS